MGITKESIQFWEPINKGDTVRVSELLDEHPQQLRAFGGIAGGTLLHYAAGNGSLDVVRLLVDRGFDVNTPGENDGDLAICNAAGRGNVEIVQFLLEQGSKLDVSQSVRNPLIAAITAGRGRNEETIMMRAPEVAEILLRAGIDHKARYRQGWLKFIDAKEKARLWGALEIRAMLLARDRADATKFEIPFEAEAFKAVARKDAQRVRELFEAYPERIENKDGLRARSKMSTAFGSWLHCAAVNSSREIAAFFLERGVDIESNQCRHTPLFTAAQNGNAEVATFLIEAGAKLPVEDLRNPLIAAVNSNSPAIAVMLLDAGIDPTPTYDFGVGKHDAEGWARQRQHHEVADAIQHWRTTH
ncbi:MAG TPA: ankyrin repeat domain-containing protein [Vitreimonas sp.]|uniref:ankyrin repeat domain-containing protein n=1 Tax=Vitreimonas sp. TaxID=3069702 RepID=UPI002D3CB646|nr:ankyrin repeat domain-containing protein [Vitreimonas sp.]HYD86813.1 ankyrin repeat domain-containing protein [Vitreimonas sp.]